MKFSFALLLFSVTSETPCAVDAFGVFSSSVLSGPSAVSSTTRIFSSPTDSSTPSVDRMKEIIEEEASNEQSMKAAAESMKNLKPEDIDMMVKEMENMNPFQRQALKAMGMDPEAMKQTMNMMKENPQMIESAQKLMENMTPQQMMEQSRMAQERMKTMTPEQIVEANRAMSSIPKDKLDEAVKVLANQPTTTTTKNDNGGVMDAEIEKDDQSTDATTETVMATGPGTSSDPKVIDAMFAVAEYMSSEDGTPQGVTLSGFAALPVVQLLSGSNDEDLKMSELKECWLTGSLGATKVDRAGFERVWKEVQDYFEDDIMGEARKEAKKQVSPKKRGSTAAKPSSPVVSTPARSSPSEATSSTIGSSMSPEQMEMVNEQVKKMSDEDVGQFLKAMENMDPAQEARMKAMGVDPSMMRNTAKMLQSNPMMRQAAQTMMKNMSPQDMMKMSQKAQEQMKNMTPEEAAQALKELDEKSKQQ